MIPILAYLYVKASFSEIDNHRRVTLINLEGVQSWGGENVTLTMLIHPTRNDDE